MSLAVLGSLFLVPHSGVRPGKVALRPRPIGRSLRPVGHTFGRRPDAGRFSVHIIQGSSHHGGERIYVVPTVHLHS